MKSSVKSSSVIFLVILFGGGYSAMANEQKRTETEMTAGALLEKADQTFQSRDYEAARETYRQALAKAEAAGQNSELTEAFAMIARTYLTTDHKEEGRPWIAKAQKTAKPEEALGWSRYLGVRGRFEWRDKELEKAAATFTEMYDYCKNRQLHERAVDAARMMAIVGTPEQQVEWGKKGIAEAEAGNVSGLLGPLWNNLGATYEKMGKYPESLAAYLKAREYHWLHGNEWNKLVADWAVGHAYRLAGDLKQAGQWLRPVLAWCERINEVEFTGWSCKDLGEIEFAEGNYKAALNYLVRAEKHLRESGMPDWDAKGFQKLVGRIDEAKSKVGE